MTYKRSTKIMVPSRSSVFTVDNVYVLSQTVFITNNEKSCGVEK